jgi:hypothetical protein
MSAGVGVLSRIASPMWTPESCDKPLLEVTSHSLEVVYSDSLSVNRALIER